MVRPDEKTPAKRCVSNAPSIPRGGVPTSYHRKVVVNGVVSGAAVETG